MDEAVEKAAAEKVAVAASEEEVAVASEEVDLEGTKAFYHFDA